MNSRKDAVDGDKMDKRGHRVYVGNLPPDVSKRDVKRLFDKYGDILHVDLKTRRGPLFAFVAFARAEDADDAVRAKNAFRWDGFRLRVEMPRTANASTRQSDFNKRQCLVSTSSVSRRSDFRVHVFGLPSSGSWQDLKDHMRSAGEVCFADVDGRGGGLVEYVRFEDMKYAVTKLDDTRFYAHDGETSIIHVDEDKRVN